MTQETPSPGRFPDDKVDNERFTGSAAGWIGIMLVGGFVLLCLTIAGSVIVYLILK